MVDTLGYLPPVLSVLREFKTLANIVDPELDLLWTEIENAFKDQYIDDATENGVERFESMLNIVPKATETIEDRKFKISTVWNEQLPYTHKSLIQRLNKLCGEDGYTLEITTLDYTVKVRIELVVKNQFDAVDSLLERIVPLNMIIDLDLRYNQHSTLANFTHAQLSAYTHKQLRDEVIS